MGYDAPDAYERLIAPRYAPVADALVELAAPAAGEDVLEVGAGTGLVTRRLGSARVVATDTSELMLERARAAVKSPDVAWVIADYTKPLPWPDESFDLVISGLTYVQDNDAAVTEVLRVLRRGGRFALSMWGAEYLELELMNRAKARRGDDLITPPDPNAVRERLTAAGFEDALALSLELAPEYPSIDDYIAYRRGFGVPAGADPDDHERYLALLGEEASAHANPDGSFTQGWLFALLLARRPA